MASRRDEALAWVSSCRAFLCGNYFFTTEDSEGHREGYGLAPFAISERWLRGWLRRLIHQVEQNLEFGHHHPREGRDPAHTHQTSDFRLASRLRGNGGWVGRILLRLRAFALKLYLTQRHEDAKPCKLHTNHHPREGGDPAHTHQTSDFRLASRLRGNGGWVGRILLRLRAFALKSYSTGRALQIGVALCLGCMPYESAFPCPSSPVLFVPVLYSRKFESCVMPLILEV